MKQKINIAIFASGSGTNAENIIKYFRNNKDIDVSSILSNNKDAYVIERAKSNNTDFFVFNREDFENQELILNYLKNKRINFIVLAGFLWLIPQYLINKFPKRIINIHPALLPKYGGKGMYGDKVHQAVYDNKDKETGITIHYVNEQYDKGDIIFQKKMAIIEKDNPETISQKVQELEYKYYPEIIEKLVLSL